MVNRCGLLTVKNEPVPLKAVSVEVRVCGFVADVSSTLEYENSESSPVEAVFVFPMDSDSAVYRFVARVGGKDIEAEVREKQEAREEYDDAMSSGQQAFLLEESDESPDVFRLSVGSLPPGQSASVSLSYVTELPLQEDGALRFCLPGVLNPRYTPAGGESVTAEAPGIPGGAVPYTLALGAHISSPSSIDRVQSNCPLSPLEYLAEDKSQAKVSLSPGHKFDRDVELLVYYTRAHEPSAILEGGQQSAPAGSLMGDTAVMLSLYPEFPGAGSSAPSSFGEFIFLVDRSGSMGCEMSSQGGGQQRIESARDTLLLLLKSLPLGCYFNIYGFGSTHESFFPESVEYSQDTMDKALAKVKTMQADLGGTEILRPLTEIYHKPCLPAHPRQLFVFTDGEVGNTKQVTDLVKTNSLSHRCFTFGIGEGASSALIRGMATEGSGHFQFITGTERLQPKVMQSLRFALQPAVREISVRWDVPSGLEVSSLSPPLKALFQGQRALLYAQLKGQCDHSAEGSVLLEYKLGDEPYKSKLSFSLKPDKESGLTIHRLGARSLLRSLEREEREQEGEEEKKAVRKRATELSTQSGVVCSHTAFIGVNKENKQPVQGPVLRRNIPRYQLNCPPMVMCFSSTAGAQMIDSSDHHFTKGVLRSNRTARSGRSSFNIFHSKSSQRGTPPAPEPQEDPLLKLISLQKANGSWDLDEALLAVLGKKKKEVASKMPGKGLDKTAWATLLALLWLHGFKLDSRDEWQFVALKAVSWIKAQPGLDVAQCVQAGATLLGCQVDPQSLGM
ncbi:von Willebrand factor A domain-containing protein 5A-like isoform X2 [Lepisosteus oculatus]|uniref:von Willebrand factor A domain-containing protein 5A-like isoform X2 n=1 Tax=Lepisosteus oculatus TaxID=7918 RepID=UPI0035F5282B